MEHPNANYVCIICANDFVGQPITIEENSLCGGCLEQLFERSVTSESNFPPRWGDKTLDPRDFLWHRVIDTQFLRRFDRKSIEYTCPAGERVYCANTVSTTQGVQPCSGFIGRRTAKIACGECEACSKITCLRCSECLKDQPSASSPDVEALASTHQCKPLAQSDDAVDTAFDGLTRGKDYQTCPSKSCRRRLELLDGCNHMTCVCETEFCFICGEKAHEGQNHWGPGKCPRFGQPESARAIYDDDGVYDLQNAMNLMDRFFWLEINQIRYRDDVFREGRTRDHDRRDGIRRRERSLSPLLYCEPELGGCTPRQDPARHFARPLDPLDPLDRMVEDMSTLLALVLGIEAVLEAEPVRQVDRDRRANHRGRHTSPSNARNGRRQRDCSPTPAVPMTNRRCSGDHHHHRPSQGPLFDGSHSGSADGQGAYGGGCRNCHHSRSRERRGIFWFLTWKKRCSECGRSR